MSKWTSDNLQNLVSFKKGKKVETSIFAQQGYLKYLGAGSLVGNDDGFASTQFAVLATENDVLMLWDGEKSGLVGHGLKGVVSSTVSKLTPSERISSSYLYYFLLNKFDWIQNRRTGTGVPHVPKDLGRILSVNFPKKLSHQDEITTILNTIDRTIEKTEALIEKYQQIKSGLMHDLFTRGVTADGKLRPTREQVPRLYKKTPIGWVPKDWKLRRCKDICTRICVGIVIQPSKYYVEEGIPALRSANVRESGLTSLDLVYISEESNLLLSKSQVRKGDILSVRTGYPGTSAVVTEEFANVNCVDILISTPGNEVNSNFLCYWVNSSFGKEQVLRLQGGMAQQHFNVGEMRELLVVLPSLKEQELISKRLDTCSTKIKIETEFLTKLKKKKAGLMHDLLTDKAQVKTEEPEAAHV